MMAELCNHHWVVTHVTHRQAMRKRKRVIIVTPTRRRCTECGLEEPVTKVKEAA